jgi:hypothetical protein
MVSRNGMAGSSVAIQALESQHKPLAFRLARTAQNVVGQLGMIGDAKLARQIQAQAGTPGMGREKRLEDRRPVRRRHTFAVVQNPKLHSVVPRRGRFEQQLDAARPARAIAQCVVDQS